MEMTVMVPMQLSERLAYHVKAILAGDSHELLSQFIEYLLYAR